MNFIQQGLIRLRKAKASHDTAHMLKRGAEIAARRGIAPAKVNDLYDQAAAARKEAQQLAARAGQLESQHDFAPFERQLELGEKPLRHPFFYVSAVDPDKPDQRWLMSGPYRSEAEARQDLPRCKDAAEEVSQRAFWMAWGTAGTEDDRGPGVLNKHGLVTLAGA